MYYKVKLTFPYPEWDLKRQTPQSSCVWSNYQFFINDEIEECDFWFVFNHLAKPVEKTFCAKQNVVLLTAEPNDILQYDQSVLDQFEHVITCQREIRHKHITYFLQGHPWFIGARYKDGHYSGFTKSYDELMQQEYVRKTKSISIVTSDKQLTEGHKRRFEFTMALKDYFGNALDVYGRGVHDFEDKWEVLADYKYSIAIENGVWKDWVTEKLYDCYLAHTFPFYYGGPNVTDYFERKSFEPIDIEDTYAAKKTIERILSSPTHYEDHLNDILVAKRKYLNDLNIFPMIASFIDQNLATDREKEEITLSNTPLAHLSLPKRLWKKVNYAYQRISR
jgi:hypothetical protein